MDVDTTMDTSHDFPSSPGGVVRWVASQSPNPALQALMREAERDRRTRPSTPVHEPMAWTYPRTSTTSSTSLSASASVSSLWHSSGQTSTAVSYPLSGSSASSSSLGPRASEPSVSRRANPHSAAQRASTSSANQPRPHSARPRSSSHSTTLSDPFTSKGKYIPKDDEPEALSFIELLKDASKQVDKNSEKKEQAAREKEKATGKEKGKEQEESLGRTGIDNRTGLDTNNLSAQPLIKTSSAFVISSTKALEKPSSTSKPTSTRKHEPRGRALTKTASLGAPGVHLVSGKSTSASLPSPSLNYNLKLTPFPWLPAGASNTSNANNTAAHKASSSRADSDSPMQDVIDLTDTDTDWEKPISGPISHADTMYMQVDDEESDTGMDVSFFQREPSSRTRALAPRPRPQPLQPTQPSGTPTQRSRTGPPLLGMRRAPQPQPSQYSSTQGSKGVTVPRFKPPLLGNAGGSANKNGSGSRHATMSSSRPPPRGSVANVPATAGTSTRANQDPDSSFDVSFDVDADALEEAMRAYD